MLQGAFYNRFDPADLLTRGSFSEKKYFIGMQVPAVRLNVSVFFLTCSLFLNLIKEDRFFRPGCAGLLIVESASAEPSFCMSTGAVRFSYLAQEQFLRGGAVPRAGAYQSGGQYHSCYISRLLANRFNILRI